MARYVHVLVVPVLAVVVLQELLEPEVGEYPLREWPICLVLLERGFRQHKLISGDA